MLAELANPKISEEEIIINKDDVLKLIINNVLTACAKCKCQISPGVT